MWKSIAFAIFCASVLVSAEERDAFIIRADETQIKLNEDVLVNVTVEFPAYNKLKINGDRQYPPYWWKTTNTCSGGKKELYMTNGDIPHMRTNNFDTSQTPYNVTYGIAYNITVHTPLSKLRPLIHSSKPRCGVWTFGFYLRESSTLNIAKSSEINITFYEEATITSISDPVTVTFKEDMNTPVNLYCNATGLPPPTVEWCRPDGLIGTANKFISLDGWLNLTTVEKTDVGEYKCTVKGITNTVEKSTQLGIQYKPDVTVTGNFHVKQMLRYNTENGCRAHAKPDITEYYWYWKYKDEPYSEENERRINLTSETSPYTELQTTTNNNSTDKMQYIPIDESGHVEITLIIRSVSLDDYKKEFHCVFKNSVGMGNNSFGIQESKTPVDVNGVKPRYTAQTKCCGASQITVSGAVLLVMIFVQYLTAQ